MICLLEPGSRVIKSCTTGSPQVKDVITSERNTVQTLLGLRVNVYLVQPEDYWFALNYITGPIEFSGLQASRNMDIVLIVQLL